MEIHPTCPRPRKVGSPLVGDRIFVVPLPVTHPQLKTAGGERRPYRALATPSRNLHFSPMPLPARRTARLRLGRVSVPHARYFLTFCAQDRAPVLASESAAPAIAATLRALHGTDFELLAATLLPDHVHLLFALGPRLTLSQTMGKFKALTRDHGRTAWRWQDNGYEHRLHTDESAEDYAFYIFMNPYRARLRPDGTPPAPWLGEVETLAARLATGE
jgi:putative transposase